MKKLSKTLITLAVLVGIVVLALPTTTVAAQGEKPPVEERRTARHPKGPEGWYAELVDKYEDVGYRLQDTDDPVRRLENRIETLTKNGEDASGVEAILDTFEANLALAQAAYDDLGPVFAAHAGFDDEGAVVDDAQAVSTLRQMAEGLLNVHQLSEDARFELRRDLMEYRYMNRSEE
jgi:hypothetical protein